MLDLYTETKQWKKVVETIERFVALESDGIRKGAYYHAAATICRDELKALDEAVDYYNQALDAFFSSPRSSPEQMLPRALKSFEAIDKVLTTKRDWKGQERAYRDMIKRMPKRRRAPMFHKLQVGLFDGLGEIYRSRLKHYQSATQAFEIAQQLDPKNEMRADGTDRAEILAELYLVAGPDYTDKAVEQHMRMLRNEPFKYDSYKALRKHLHGRAPVRQDLVRLQHARLPEEGRPGRAAVLRAVQAAWPRQGEERDERRRRGASSSTPTRTATSARSSARAGRASPR